MFRDVSGGPTGAGVVQEVDPAVDVDPAGHALQVHKPSTSLLNYH